MEAVNPEKKMNMSLDDLIKLKQSQKKETKTAKKKKAPPAATPAANKQSQKEKKNAKISAKPSPALNARKNKKQIKSKNSDLIVAAAKVAKAIGASQAKRAAAIANRRGLSATAQPTKEQLKKSVENQLKKTSKPSGGLKISFNTKELNKTTDKDVSLQIKAVLSRQGTPKTNNAQPKTKGNRR